MVQAKWCRALAVSVSVSVSVSVAGIRHDGHLPRSRRGCTATAKLNPALDRRANLRGALNPEIHVKPVKTMKRVEAKIVGNVKESPTSEPDEDPNTWLIEAKLEEDVF